MNIERSFKFAFKAPSAFQKLVLGGLFSLLFFTVFFAFVVVGYIMRVLCNALEGRDAVLPEWADLRTLFNEGLQPMLIILSYCSPLIVLSIIEIQLVTMGVSVGVFLPIQFAVMLIISTLLPLALIRCMISGTLKAAFEFGRILDFIKSNVGTYLSAWGLSLVVSMVAIFTSILVLAGSVGLGYLGGPIALRIGLALVAFVFAFASFIANVIIVHIYAQAYRASTPFTDDEQGAVRASMAVPPPLRE
ncbi:MAG: DUF4013 domain-containing protein [Proteobacteria bacterium]|nr:DUF4013 domain-containing protein [Pseudomonadota bacterium]